MYACWPFCGLKHGATLNCMCLWEAHHMSAKAVEGWLLRVWAVEDRRERGGLKSVQQSQSFSFFGWILRENPRASSWQRGEPGILFNDVLLLVAGTGSYHSTAERNTMCAHSGWTFLMAPWFPKVIHAVLIPTVMALSWGSVALWGPPHSTSLASPIVRPLQLPACRPLHDYGWWESGRGQRWWGRLLRVRLHSGQLEMNLMKRPYIIRWFFRSSEEVMMFWLWNSTKMLKLKYLPQI